MPVVLNMTSQKPLLLVTTALEPAWGSNETILFLGEWCRLYERRDAWGNREYSVVRNHWDDRQKLRRDYDHLKNLHESLLEHLSAALNNYHQIEKPLRYWRMILDPWLLTYVAVIFDRWECLRIAFNDHNQFETVALEPCAEHETPLDYSDFVSKALGDVWNYQLFLEIIESTYSDQCGIRKASSPLFLKAEVEQDAATCAKPKPKSKKRKIAAFADRLVGKLFPRSRVVFFESYFPSVAMVKLCFKLGQFPRLYLDDFEWTSSSGTPDKSSRQGVGRSNFVVRISAANPFEAFLFKRIVKDIPVVCLEMFAALKAKGDRISMRPKAIFTGTGHWGNEMFKLWSAEQVSMGCKLVTIQHGGSINTGTMTAMNFEEDIADYFVTPSVPCHPKHVQLPFVKLAGAKAVVGGGNCSLLAFEGQRYSLRAEAWPISGQALINYYQSVDFYKCLAAEVQKSFRVRPHSGQAWSTRKRYVDDIGSEVLCGKIDYYDFLNESRVIVCTYPNTTFAEAMASGLPTILLYPGHLWELNPASYTLLKILMTAKIVFHDHQAAADHVNFIWSDPGAWWNSTDVSSARNEFHRQAVYQSDDWLNKWTTFVKNVTT